MKKFTLILIAITLINCKSPPKESLSQLVQKITDKVENDSLIIEISNPVKCPLRTSAKSKNESINALLAKDFPIILPPLFDTIFKYPTELQEEDFTINFSTTIGDYTIPIKNTNIALPFPKGKTYKIIQGFNGSFSHDHDFSRYAIDFSLNIGDTICAAADGYVVGLIQGYKYGGSTKKWRKYANFVTLFHPTTNFYTQYVHLQHKGSFVELGDEVKTGEAIALSGMTGFTTVPHLHFNVLQPTDNGMISFKTDSIGNYKGSTLSRGKTVRH